MAELFSLMPESTSCKSDPVEATRTLSRAISPDLFQRNAPATGEISRDAYGARLHARRETVYRFALEMTRGLVSFRARVGDTDRVVRVTTSGSHREESRPRHSHTLSMECAKPSPSVPSLSVVADGPSAIGGSRRWPRQTVRKSMTEKAAETNPMSRNRQYFQGVYFFSD
jgi:hypothetical protein